MCAGGWVGSHLHAVRAALGELHDIIRRRKTLHACRTPSKPLCRFVCTIIYLPAAERPFFYYTQLLEDVPLYTQYIQTPTYLYMSTVPAVLLLDETTAQSTYTHRLILRSWGGDTVVHINSYTLYQAHASCCFMSNLIVHFPRK